MHVSDLADAHTLALEHLLCGGDPAILNVGIGQGFSVREVLRAIRRVTGLDVPVRLGSRRSRDADPPVLIADASLCRRILGFAPRYTDVEAMIATAWRWHLRRQSGASLLAVPVG